MVMFVKLPRSKQIDWPRSALSLTRSLLCRFLHSAEGTDHAVLFFNGVSGIGGKNRRRFADGRFSWLYSFLCIDCFAYFFSRRNRLAPKPTTFPTQPTHSVQLHLLDPRFLSSF